MAALAITSPLPQFFDLDSSPLDAGRIYFGQVGQNPETAPVTVYWDSAATQPAAQPVPTLNGYIVRGSSTSGTPALIYATAGFSMTVKDRRGRLLLYVPDSSAFNLADAVRALSVDLADTSDVTKGDALVGVKRTASGAIATTAHDWIERQQLDTFADFGLNPDGVTDRTAAINAITAALGAAGFRGALRIPAGTKFNPTSVFAAVPTGVMLDITDSVNWGQPPGYRNRFKILYSGDTVSDDTQQIVASNHHPAIMLLNMGTAASVAAASRYGTILHGVGRDVAGDPMLGWLQQFAKSPTANKWRVSWRLQTPYNVAVANPTYWTSGQVVAAGSYRLSDGDKVYQTSAGGTCGGVAPTGTGTGINDGGVLWDYVQAALGIDSTRMDLDEDGNVGFYGPMTVRATLTGGSQTAYFEVNSTTGDVTLRDDLRSTDLWRSSTTNGVRSGRIQSFNRVNSTISATGAFQLVTGLHFLTASGGPWDITDLTLPTGQTSGEVTLWFAGTNLTIKNNANIVTRTGADIASAANMMVTLYKDTAVSSSWVVKSKN